MIVNGLLFFITTHRRRIVKIMENANNTIYYRYYSTQRPVDLGTFPKSQDNAPVSINNFDRRCMVADCVKPACGYLIYLKPLTQKQMEDYELESSTTNPD